MKPKELFKAMKDAVDADVTLTAAIEGFYLQGSVPRDTSMPYITMMIVDSAPRLTFRTSGEFEDVLMQLTIYHAGSGVEGISDIWELLNDVFHRVSLTYDSQTAIGCVRERTGAPEWIEDGWQWSTDYRVNYA